MFFTDIPVYAENGNNPEGEQNATVNYMFGSADKAYATDILYVNEIGMENGVSGLYVIGGKGFYTSPDGVSWTERASGQGMEAVKEETYGFAYGGPIERIVGF